MAAFTRDQLRAFAPAAKSDILDVLISGAGEIEAAGITPGLRLQHFLAQIATETGGLRLLEENLSYSAERLVQVWPSRFPTIAKAKPYARNPKKLAAKVYGGRLGNRNDADAWAYRGSGLMQTTGLSNFTRAGYADKPDELRTPAGALTSALKFWTDNDCSAFADRDDVVGLRKRINGGTHGLPETRAYLAKAKRILVDDLAVALHPEDLSPGKIRALQEQLVKLGYTGVGRPDGQMGSMTIGAISAFQAESGLEVTGRFDAETQEHLYEAQPRTVVRSSAEPADSRILGHAKALKTGAVGLLSTAGISASADPLSQFEAAKAYVDRAKLILSPLSGVSEFLTQHWLLIAVAVAGFVFLYGKKIQDARLDDHLSGASA